MARLVHDFLFETARRLPGKMAVITDAASVTYGELADQSRRFAAWLRSVGVLPSDRCLVILPNAVESVVAVMGASAAGTIFSVVHPQIKPYHLSHILQDAEPGVIVTTAEHARRLGLGEQSKVLTVEDDWAEVLATPPVPEPTDTGSESIASLIYTSGSTGRPKAVVSRHQNVLFAVHAIQERLQMEESDIVACLLPLSFDYGLYQIYLIFLAGGTVYLGGASQTGPALLRKLTEFQVTGLPLVPGLASNLIQLAKRKGAALPPLRYITNTGAHLPRAYVQELQALFPTARIYLMFGLTECKRVSILLPSEYPGKPNSVGRPLADTTCHILREDGTECRPGEIGELVVLGPHVMAGYWREPGLTGLRFRPWGTEGDRALYTGDLCSMDQDGFLYFWGRSDDIYKQDGYRVSGVEVEKAACSIPGADQAALVAPFEGHGASLFYCGEASVEQVSAGLRQRLEEYKVPPVIRQVDTIPLSPHGKVDRRQLRELLQAASQR